MSPAIPVANGGSGAGAVVCNLGEITFSLVDLRRFLHKHRDWLKANYGEDQGWQQFLAQGEPAEGSVPQHEMDDACAAAIKQCVPALVRLLTTGDVLARLQAAILLGQAGPTAAPAAPALAAAANDPEQRVREMALWALECLGPAAKEAAPRLDALMRSEDARCHPLEGAVALVAIDPAADVVPLLVQSLSDQRTEIGVWALGLLSSRERSHAAVAAPAIAALIDDENSEVRMEAVTTYSRLADVREAIPLLQAALRNEEDRGVKRHMARTIVRLQNAPLEP